MGNSDKRLSCRSQALEEQLQREFLALEAQNNPLSSDEQLKAEVQVLLDRYQLTPELMWRILAL